MDRTGEGASKRPSPATPIADQTLQVNPDNVIDLAVFFRGTTDQLDTVVEELKRDLRLPEPWLGDPVSEWIWELFNRYFIFGENSFFDVVRDLHLQHQALAEALKHVAQRYGMGDALNAALFERLGPGR